MFVIGFILFFFWPLRIQLLLHFFLSMYLTGTSLQTKFSPFVSYYLFTRHLFSLFMVLQTICIHECHPHLHTIFNYHLFPCKSLDNNIGHFNANKTPQTFYVYFLRHYKCNKKFLIRYNSSNKLTLSSCLCELLNSGPKLD